jgi:hypothetical protein
MSEERMVELVQEALQARGIEDQVLAAGQFEPRGHVGGLFAGGMIGGDLADGVGLAVGSIAGMKAADASSGLPSEMLVGVSDSAVYGFAAKTRHSEPSDLVFGVKREGLTVKVHQRVNVRILELIDESSGSRIELEGNRVPLTHSKDVIALLSS